MTMTDPRPTSVVITVSNPNLGTITVARDVEIRPPESAADSRIVVQHLLGQAYLQALAGYGIDVGELSTKIGEPA